MPDNSYYELRIYETVPGRLPGLEAVMAEEVPPILRRLGFNVLVNYLGAGGPYGPIYGYLLRWPDLDTRMRAWDAFYTDPEWLKAYAARFGDGPRVERQNLSILRAAPIWDRFRTQGSAPVGGIYELRRHDTRGQDPDRAAEGIAAMLAKAEAAGGRVLGVFDSVLGEPAPRLTALIAWPDMAALAACSLRDAPAAPPHDAFFLRPARDGMARDNLADRGP